MNLFIEKDITFYNHYYGFCGICFKKCFECDENEEIAKIAGV